MEYFATEFGFTPLEVILTIIQKWLEFLVDCLIIQNDPQVTALMGAHTIGNAEIFNSGFHGPWVSGEATMFNNQYYANLRFST